MRPALDVLSVGNLVVDFVAGPVPGLPPWGTLFELSHPLEPAVGGNGAIFSVAASRLGLKCAAAGRVGRDFFGKWLLGELESEGVRTDLVRRGARGTSSTIAVVNPRGERSFLHYTGSGSSLTGADLGKLPRCRWLHLSSLFLLPRLGARSAGKVLQAAKRAGASTSLDVAWDPSGRWELGDCLRHADLFLPNLDEARALTGEERPEDCARALRERGAGAVVIKMGARGSLVLEGEGGALPARPFEVEAVDSTGAGDVFDAALVYARLRGMELPRAAVLANAAGALSVTARGGVRAAPFAAELLDFIRASRRGRGGGREG